MCSQNQDRLAGDIFTFHLGDQQNYFVTLTRQEQFHKSLLSLIVVYKGHSLDNPQFWVVKVGDIFWEKMGEFGGRKPLSPFPTSQLAVQYACFDWNEVAAIRWTDSWIKTWWLARWWWTPPADTSSGYPGWRPEQSCYSSLHRDLSCKLNHQPVVSTHLAVSNHSRWESWSKMSFLSSDCRTQILPYI